MARILAIDTSSAVLALALGEPETPVRVISRPCATDHSRMLLPAIVELAGEGRDAFDAMVALRGPGSYAGIRVGLATASALALARGLPLAGVTTFEAVAAADGRRSLTAIHPAGRGTFAVQDFEDGVPVGPMRAVQGGDLRGAQLAGEGAGQFGGREVTAAERVAAALALGATRLEMPGHVAALYLRPPGTTPPKRALAARSA